MGFTLTEPEIRTLNPDDVESLASLEGANQPQPWSPGVFIDELRARNRIYLAVVNGEQLYGFGGVMISGEEAHITNLLIAPDQRRRGLAKRLLVALISKSIESGARHLTLEVRSKNQAAMELYRQFGLGPVGVRKNYYDDDDALILWANDIDKDEYAARLEELN